VVMKMMHDSAAMTPMYSDQGMARCGASPWMHSIQLITAEELARELRFDGPTSAFRKFCKSAGIEPVPGRRDCYDPIAVRHKLNEIQGLGSSGEPGPQGALTRSMMRRNG
jgi:hypothetical protein